MSEASDANNSWELLSDKLGRPVGRFVFWVIVFQVVLWIYSPSFSGPFVYDGVASIANNEEMRQPGKWWQLFKRHENSLQFDRRPVAGLLTLLNFQMSGLKVFGYRLVNLAIHWTSAILIAEVIILLGKRWWNNSRDLSVFALAVALLWVVHPLNATPVVYVYQRTESLSALFFLLCLYAMLRSSAPGGGFPMRWRLLILCSGALSMLSKESGVALLVVLPLFDRYCHYQSWRHFFQERGRFYAGFAVMTGLLVVYFLTGARVDDVRLESPLGSPVEYAKSQFRILLRYLKLVFWPEPLIFVTAPRHVVSVSQWLPQAILLGLIIAAGALDISYEAADNMNGVVDRYPDDPAQAPTVDELDTILAEIPNLVDVGGQQQPDPWIYHVFFHKGTNIHTFLEKNDEMIYKARGMQLDDYALFCYSGWSDEEAALAILHEMGHSFENPPDTNIPFYQWDKYPEDEWPADVKKSQTLVQPFERGNTSDGHDLSLVSFPWPYDSQLGARATHVLRAGIEAGEVIEAPGEWMRSEDWKNYNERAKLYEQ